MIRKKNQKALIKITNKFFEGQYTDNVGLFEAAHAALKEEVLSKKEMSQLTKLFSIFF